MLRFLYHKILAKLNLQGRDVTVMLLSLLLAFGIWMVRNLSLDYSSIVSVPVVAESQIEGYSALSSTSSVIAARCRTSGFHIVHLNRAQKRDPIVVHFDAKDLHRGEEDQFYITAVELGGYVNDIFGEDVMLESFVSNNVQFRFSPENFKKVPVQVVHLIDFKDQYMATEPMSVQPDSVVIYGEPSRLESIDRILTQTISHSDVKSGVHGVVKLEVPKSLRISASEVSYSMNVSRYVEVKEQVKIRVLHAPAGKELSIYPSTAEVVFRCSFPLRKNPTSGISFYIDYDEFVNSISGRCVARISSQPQHILDYRIEPEVFECLESSH